jgi:hypothetical protein
VLAAFYAARSRVGQRPDRGAAVSTEVCFQGRVMPVNQHRKPERGSHLASRYIALACFSARSPITGSLYIWP